MSQLQRCDWAATDAIFFDYHDHEWGVPKYGTTVIFEFLILEMMQAGLSWRIVLQKREAMSQAFDRFAIEKIAAYREKKVARLLDNAGIIRNRLKIRAMINNAQQCLRLAEQGKDLASLVWQLSDGKPIINHWRRQTQIPASTALSDEMSKMLKAEGFKFIGTTICYSLMQAIGMVDDHLAACYKRS